MDELTFRPAVRADLPAVLALLADDVLGSARETEQSDAAYWAAFEAIDADPRNELIIAVRGDQVIGTCQLTYLPGLSRGGAWRMQVEAVRVRSDLRGAGIGAELMRWTIERARERGCKLVQLTSDHKRTDAHRFYERLGFTGSHLGMKLAL